MSIFGREGEYKPRFGLWLDTSPECWEAVTGLLSEGFDCDVVLKMGCRCEKHAELSHRPVMSLLEYYQAGGDVEPKDCQRVQVGGVEFGCYVREVFFPERLNLRRRVA